MEMDAEGGPDEGQQRRRAATLSLVVGVVVLVVKLGAAAVTGSAALFGDALESTVNVVAGLMVLRSVRWANTPPDDDHPFGHGRVEALSAATEGALLLAAAAGIVWSALPALLQPRQLQAVELGLGLVAATMVVNFAVGRWLMRQGRRLRSIALAADGRHLTADALTTVAMIVGIGLVELTGWWWLDPVLALCLAVWIAVSGVRVAVEAGRFLMNAQSADDVNTLAEHLAAAGIPAACAPHGLRILHGGRARFVYLEIVAPADWTLGRANALAERIQQLARDAFAGDVSADVKVVPASSDAATKGNERWVADADALTRGQ